MLNEIEFITLDNPDMAFEKIIILANLFKEMRDLRQTLY